MCTNVAQFSFISKNISSPGFQIWANVIVQSKQKHCRQRQDFATKERKYCPLNHYLTELQRASYSESPRCLAFSFIYPICMPNYCLSSKPFTLSKPDLNSCSGSHLIICILAFKYIFSFTKTFNCQLDIHQCLPIYFYFVFIQSFPSRLILTYSFINMYRIQVKQMPAKAVSQIQEHF